MPDVIRPDLSREQYNFLVKIGQITTDEVPVVALDPVPTPESGVN